MPPVKTKHAQGDIRRLVELPHQMRQAAQRLLAEAKAEVERLIEGK